MHHRINKQFFSKMNLFFLCATTRYSLKIHLISDRGHSAIKSNAGHKMIQARGEELQVLVLLCQLCRKKYAL